MSSKKYDVFLSHHSADKSLVERIAQKLREANVKPFLDKWHLIPGDPWQEGLEKALGESATCAVFLGSHGVGTWENEEMRAALTHRAQSPTFRVVPVLLPGRSISDSVDLPPFLSRLTWVEFRSDLEEPVAFWRLLCGIRNQQHEPSDSRAHQAIEAAIPEGRCPYKGIEHFRIEDADLFFGRATLTKYLVERLRNPRFLAIIGPSGSGKSSLIRAGLIPALRRGDFREVRHGGF